MTTTTTTATPSLSLRDEERQRCEVWTRVMGYHRPVSSFNIGKQGEHAERRFFTEQAITGNALSGQTFAEAAGNVQARAA